MLDRHNAFRRAHGVPALTLDPKVQNLDFFQHSANRIYPNIFRYMRKNPNFSQRNESELPSLVQITEVEKHIGIDQIFLTTYTPIHDK